MLGVPVLTTGTDSSSGKAFLSKNGLSSKLKHMQLRHLWIQDCFHSGESKLAKFPTLLNLGDIGTKHPTVPMLMRLLPLVGITSSTASMTADYVQHLHFVHFIFDMSAQHLISNCTDFDSDDNGPKIQQALVNSNSPNFPVHMMELILLC